MTHYGNIYYAQQSGHSLLNACLALQLDFSIDVMSYQDMVDQYRMLINLNQWAIKFVVLILMFEKS